MRIADGRSGNETKGEEMVFCKRCGRKLKISSALKGRSRHENVEKECLCGYLNIITKEDVEESERRKLSRIPKRARL